MEGHAGHRESRHPAWSEGRITGACKLPQCFQSVRREAKRGRVDIDDCQHWYSQTKKITTGMDATGSQVEKMQEMGVVAPSESPWSSPVVLVRKDRTHVWTADEVTKRDGFPLPRVDDLLNQSDHSRYFSTLDLAAGFGRSECTQTQRRR